MLHEQETKAQELNDRIIMLESKSHTVVETDEDPEPIVVLVQPVVYQVNEKEEPKKEETDIFEGQEYLEQCVEAEAGNQGILGKAYVCDVILNRLDWEDYKDVYDVINDRGQFQCVSNGTINRVLVSEETKYVVSSELKGKTNEDITFFRTKQYHRGTIPCFQYGAHYFSK